MRIHIYHWHNWGQTKFFITAALTRKMADVEFNDYQRKNGKVEAFAYRAISSGEMKYLNILLDNDVTTMPRHERK